MNCEMDKNKSRIVIVADGSFPVHEIPLTYLRNAAKIVCCDGSASTLVSAGFIPDAIVGDMDSLDEKLAERFSDRIHVIPEQETNDLTKSVNWCIENGYDDLVILGATGKREDHTLGNISLLAEYVKSVRVTMVTDTGFLIPLIGSATLPACKGQQISIFSIDNSTEITSSGLKFPLYKTRLGNWWQATLNECTGESFSLEFSSGRLILYMKFL
jgi:thiamine pyrophosphokinase